MSAKVFVHMFLTDRPTMTWEFLNKGLRFKGRSWNILTLQPKTGVVLLSMSY